MAVALRQSRAPQPSSLADVIDVILDRGIVIDAYVRVSLVGIELVTIDARIVVASVDTYLRFAQMVNRLDLGGSEPTESRGLPEEIGKMSQSGAQGKTEGALSGAAQSLKNWLGGDEQEGQGEGDEGSREDDEGGEPGARGQASASSGDGHRSRQSSRRAPTHRRVPAGRGAKR